MRSVDGDLEDVMDNINVTIETPLERWRRDASSAPLLTDDHRIAWLCGDPSKYNFFYLVSRIMGTLSRLNSE